jgi:hypothetical protein
VPEVSRGHAVGSSSDRRVVAVCLLIIGLPFIGGIVGSVMLVDEAIGPLVTLALWLGLLFWMAAVRKGGVMEWLAVIGILVTLQLLLDMLRPHLGDVVIAVLHALYVAAVLWDRLRCSRDRQGRDHEQL